MKNLTVKIESRIKTKEGNFIGISIGEYGKYHCIWFNEKLECVTLASAEQWFWATTWGTTLEHGDWVVTMPVAATPVDPCAIEIETEYRQFNIRFSDLQAKEWEGDGWRALHDSTSDTPEEECIVSVTGANHFNTSTQTFAYDKGYDEAFVETQMVYDRTEGTCHYYVTPYGEYKSDFSDNIR